MSHNIITIKAKREADIRRTGIGVEYKSQTLSVSTYWGGKEDGVSLQLTLDNDYVQLTNAQVTKLLRAILEGMKLKEAP